MKGSAEFKVRDDRTRSWVLCSLRVSVVVKIKSAGCCDLVVVSCLRSEHLLTV